MHDIRYALRLLRRSRLFTVILTIAIGIGWTTTIFSVVFVACAVPALRASRVDPMVALRAD